jgi:hypothetical protein
MKVVCINDSKRPAGVPANCWIEKGKTYTVIDAKNMARQRGILGYKFAEISMPEDSEYQYYSAHRFRPVDDVNDSQAEEAVEELLEEVFEEELV